MAGRSRKGGRGGASKSGSQPRQMATRVRTAKGRKTSSTAWLKRQLNDPYVARAKAEGFRSRAAYKLSELDDRFRLLKPGHRVIDLGAAPGGWSQVAAQRVHSDGQGGGLVIAADIADMDGLSGVGILKLDLREAQAVETLIRTAGGKVDVVLSDMAPSTTGHAATDHVRIVALVEIALHVAQEVLRPGGSFIAKVFKGGAEGDLLKALKRDFETVKHAKPGASRPESAETYVVATGYKGLSTENKDQTSHE